MRMAYCPPSGSPIPANHPAWQAQKTGTFRGEGEIVWRSGHRRNMWLDAVAAKGVVTAIFSADRYWAASGLGILSDPSQTKATPYLVSGTCWNCGAGVYGTRTCEQCGDIKCRGCGRCGCGKPKPLVRTCRTCQMIKGKAQFRSGAEMCRECELSAPR